MEPIELIGFAAGLMVAISSFPQLIKSWKTKSTKDISIARAHCGFPRQIPKWLSKQQVIFYFSPMVLAMALVKPIYFIPEKQEKPGWHKS